MAGHKLFAYRDHLLPPEYSPDGSESDTGENRIGKRGKPLKPRPKPGYGMTYYFVAGLNRKNTDPKWEDVRDFFEGEFSMDEYFGMFEYHRSEISESAFDLADVETGDIVFEMGELGSARLKYSGHYHRNSGELELNFFGGFDEDGLSALLDELFGR